MTIGKRIFIAGFVAIASLALVSGLGIWGTFQASRGTARVNVMSAAIRNQMEADMMHDALRADVLVALREGRAGNMAAQPKVAADTADHIKDFQDRLAANEALDLPPEARTAVDGVGPALATYIAAAQEIVDQAFTDNGAANAGFPAFLEKFEALEVKMSDTSDAIQHSADVIRSDIDTSVHNLLMARLAVIAGAMLAEILVLVWVSRSIVRPITAMTGTMSRLAGGDMTAEIPGRERSDEIGAMAQALDVLKENSTRAQRLSGEQAHAHEFQRKRGEALERLCHGFDADMSETLTAVAGSLQAMQQAVQSMARSAEQTAGEASQATEASSQTATSVDTVAGATGELSNTINEITRQVSQSHQIAGEAAHQARQTNDQIKGLATAAEKVGAIVQLINEIASQTNLLALNATIEAARAGEMGKGFAVVASEVKNLASQTAKATDEIASHVGAIQTETQRSVTAIQGVARIIEQINQITSSVSAAVEEQGAATREIVRSVEQAADGTRSVNASIGTVVTSAAESRNAAARLTEVAAALGTQSQSLRSGVERFLADVKAV